MNRKRASIVFFSVLFLLAGAAGVGLAADKEVTVLVTGGLTGPTSPLAVPACAAIKALVGDLNTQGGIGGVKINVIFSDDRYTASRAISFYQRYRQTEKLATVFSIGTPQAYILDPVMSRDKIPQITTGGGRFQYKPGWTFLLVPPYQNMAGAAIDLALADWKKKGMSGNPVFAYMGWGGPSGLESTNGSDKYAEKMGVKWLPPVLTTPGTLKYDTWLTSLADSGANYIYVHMVDPDQTFVVRDAYNLGLTKKIQFISSIYGLQDTVGLRLVKPEVVEGTIVMSNVLMGEERLKHPDAQLWTKYEQKPLEDTDDAYLWGIGIARFIVASIRATLGKVGYDAFTGAAMYEAMQHLKGDLTNGIMGVQNLSPTSRMITTSFKYYRVTNGKNVPLSGSWVEAPDCLSLATFSK